MNAQAIILAAVVALPAVSHAQVLTRPGGAYSRPRAAVNRGSATQARPVIASFSATPSTQVAYQSVTLSWSVSGASSLSISPTVGAVTGTSTTVSPTATTTYTLTASNAGGSVTASATVTITGPYLISDSAGTVCHAWWDGTSIRDTKGCSWTMNGTVPQVAATAGRPAGAGPFADANNYQLGTGSDGLDFTGDYSVCVVFYDRTAGYPVHNGNTPSSGAGYRLELFNSASFRYATPSGANANTLDVATTLVAASVNCVCFGMSGTTQVTKGNLGTVRTATPIGRTNSTSFPARIGRGETTTHAFANTIYEVWFSTDTPTDALFTAIQQQVKSRAGVSAW